MTAAGVAWKAEAGVFLVVAFLAAGALGAVQPATGIPTVVVQLTQFGPALGVAAVALLWPSRIRHRLAGALPARRAVDSAGSTARRHSRGTGLPLTAVLTIGLSAGTYAWVEGALRVTALGTLGSPFALIVAAQLVGACGEEIGWRCLLQPLLRTRFGPFTSSVAVGLLWGAWHVQVFGRGPAYAAGFPLATVAMSVVLGLALERSGANRLLLAGGFHTLVNLGMLLFMDDGSGSAPATDADLSMVLGHP
ncbi:CPBP family intramembrane metalloprotease [Streptomyces sp. SP17BM10]|uniref:CPBP family intramembrane glutamic endopeptidase n=1 Tax=Streptomyces sp. SP17BM10 TaxID=3002530 RepID=UPI002E76E339|nr:CPBP family intramembrane glutamic endopeptidase [Streptomyces sp. SP17BM10]MEE1786864.1 CPBP family intramembrane metalloprotease [Streptomyces sp. SP17BM10]